MPRTAFDPQVHGFAFTNSFQFTAEERGRLIAALATAIDGALGALGPLGLAARVTGMRDKLATLLVSAVPQRYGLCGGMAFAALDYFRAGLATPRGGGPDDQPAVGSQLRIYLWERLLEGWVLNGATFLEWIAACTSCPRAGHSTVVPVLCVIDRCKLGARSRRRSTPAGRFRSGS